jgi:predicted transcriptional regulator
MTNYSLLSFVLRGERRKAILLCLNKPMIPKEIADCCKVSIHNVSKSLKELVDRGLIVCNNPQSHVYKYYELTKKGKEILKELDKTTK